jgi:hypothetical protein
MGTFGSGRWSFDSVLTPNQSACEAVAIIVSSGGFQASGAHKKNGRKLMWVVRGGPEIDGYFLSTRNSDLLTSSISPACVTPFNARM